PVLPHRSPRARWWGSVGLGAGRGVLAAVEQEGVLRQRGELDLVAGAEQLAAAGVLLEDDELLAPGHPHEVRRGHTGEADVADHAAGDRVARRRDRQSKRLDS